MSALLGGKPRKYKVDTYAVCSDCMPEQEYSQPAGDTMTADAWAKKHVLDNPGHIVTIHEAHDVSAT